MSDVELEASIVAVVDAVRGDWCTPAWVAEKAVTTPRLAAAMCYQLAVRGELQSRLQFGERVYGLQVVSDHAGTRDVRPDGVHPGECIRSAWLA